jgi:hypothetical protein
VAFIQLLTHVVTNNSKNIISSNYDIELLQSFVSMVQTVADMSEPKSYITRLDALARTLINFAAPPKQSPSPAQLTSKPWPWHTSSIDNVGSDEALPIAMTASATEQFEQTYHEFEAFDNIDTNSGQPVSNLPFLLNMADGNNDFFAGWLSNNNLIGDREKDPWV